MSESSIELADLSPEQKRALLSRVLARKTQSGSPSRERCIHQLFEEQAARHPEAPALRSPGQTLSYRELNARANQVAHRLLRLGIKPEQRVGLCLERGLNAIIALVGVFKAGAVHVPLDAGLPRERLQFVLRDAQVEVLLTREGLLGILDPASPSSPRILCLDRDGPDLALESRDNPCPGVSLDNLAYIIYTSGTTGQPRGVLLAHRGLVNLITAQVQLYEVRPGSCILQFSSLSFDASVGEVWRTLASGACLCLAEPSALLPGPDMLRMLEDQKITHVTLPPSVLSLLPPAPLPWLQTVIVGGEVCPADLVARWAPGRRFFNGYGPTEATVCATVARCDPDGTKPSIGRPLPNVRAYVADEHLQLAPLGMPGELYLGGVGLARGYCNQPGLTASRFLPDPFSAIPGARLYKTGDQVRWLPGNDRLPDSGNLEFLARVDQQVKVRGFRIELGEIEAVLAENVNVQQSVVVLRDDLAGGPGLVAYLVARDTVPDTDTLRSLVRQRLPDYMMPAAFVFLPALPLTPNGKVDRQALPPPPVGPDSARDYAAPRTPTEEALAEVWAEVLQQPRIGSRDNFFDLGGHSLLCARVVSRLRQTLSVELPLRDMFEMPILADLAQRIDTLRDTCASRQSSQPMPTVRSGPLPLSFAQQRMWFLDQLAPGAPLYRVPGRLLLQKPLRLAALERALAELIRRHEVLRTRFTVRGGQPIQVVDPPGQVRLNVEDLRSLPPQRLQAEIRRLGEAQSRRTIDLAAGPLLRMQLLRLTDQESVLQYLLHHIVTDGWSQDIFKRELTTLYEAFATGQSSPLPDLPLQYADYAVWQRNWLRGDTLEQQVSYWRTQLQGVSPLELPTDRPRPSAQTFRSRRAAFALSIELTDRLQQLSRQHGTTLFMTLLAGFQAVLGRYSGQNDFAVGSPIAGRTHEELEGLIGLFVNTLVLRADLSGDPNFVELLHRVRERCLGAYAHQDIPFEKLVEELHPQRDLNRSPVVQVLFVLQAYRKPVSLPAIPVAPAGSKNGEQFAPVRGMAREGLAEQFDLGLYLTETPEGVRGMARYSADLFEETTITRLLHHLHSLLEQVVSDPYRTLSHVVLLDDSERRQLMGAFNTTHAEYPRDVCLHHLIEQQAARSPGAIAVVFADQRLSYAELNARANQLAQYLRSLGVGADVPVAICMERSVEMVVGLLGILKAGGAYVPLDPNYPAERLAFMLQDVHPPVLLTQQALLGRVNSSNATVLCLDSDWPQVALSAACGLADSAKAHPDNLAYIIYTSGSTGKPKGAMNAHKGIVNRLLWMQDAYHLDESDRVLQKTPFSFDVSVWELFWPLISGARLVLARPGGHQDSAYLAQLIATEGITTLHFVPSMLSAFLHEHDLSGCVCLRRVICSGEALSFDLQERFFARLEAELHNLYGPTEASVDVTFHACQRGSKRRIVPIGKPIANTQMFVLDTHQQLVPLGVAGELHIGGIALARGYWRRPELTAEKFVPDPFSTGPGARLYKTGDRARWLPDGSIEYLGRIDFQVKIRGNRIELGEIESVLNRHPNVRESVVVVRDIAGGKGLVGYLVARQAAPSPAELRAHLRVSLPEYMVPPAFVTLDALPLTPNGKLDRNALPAPVFRSGASAYTAPVTPAEETLDAIWADLLQVDLVGIHDNFFELGGHSLLATQVVSRLRQSYGVDLPLRAIFETPTIAGLAQRIDTLRREQAGTQAPPLRAVPRTGELPLSFSQQRLWFLDQLDPGSPTYNIPSILPLPGPLDLDAMRNALGEILRRHEALRTRFPTVDGQPVQVIDPASVFSPVQKTGSGAFSPVQKTGSGAFSPVQKTGSGAFSPVDLPVIDLTGFAVAQRLSEARLWAAQEAAQPFDLAAGPLLRATLIRIGPEQHRLLLTMHHIVSDGWSQDVLLRELPLLYAAFHDGNPSPLPDPPLQYVDYAVWQRNWLQGEGLQRQLGYWRQRLRDLPTLDLPTDLARPPAQRFRGAWHDFVLTAERVSSLRALSKQHGSTLFMTLLAAFQTLLGRYSQQTDFAVGTPVAGRTHKELEGLVGFFVNTLVLRADLSGDPTFVDLLHRVRETCMDAYDHQDLPFDKLVDELQIVRDPSRNPLFQVLFVLQNLPGAAREAFQRAQQEAQKAATGKKPARGPRAPTDTRRGNGTSKFDLGLQCFELPNGTLRCLLAFNTDLFVPETIARLGSHYSALLAGIAADPRQRLSAFSLVDPDEGADLLRLGQTSAQQPEDPLLAQLDSLSDEELDALLEQTLAERQSEQR